MEPLQVPDHRSGQVAPDARESIVRPWASPLRCCQCGREGHNSFGIIAEAVHPPTGAHVGPFIVCASRSACMKRWPRRSVDVD